MILPKSVWLTVLALIIVGGVFVLTTMLLPNLSMIPQALDRGGLASIIETEQARVLLRTRSVRIIESAMTLLGIEEEIPELPDRGHYELALLTQSGLTVSAIAAVDQFGEIVSAHAGGVSVTSAPTATRPLSRDAHFRRLSRGGDDLLWFRSDAIHNIPIFHALLAPASDISLRWNDDGRSGTMTLAGASVRSGMSTHSTPSVQSGSDILFRGSIALPGWFGASWSTLEDTNPDLAAGLRGIALAYLQRETGSTDLSMILALIRGQPFSMLLTREADGSVTPFIAGSVRSPRDLTTLLAMLRSRNAAGTVRTIDLLGENVRTDLILDSDGETSTLGDWEVAPLSTDLLFAARGREFLLGSMESIALIATSSIEQVSSRGVLDLSWAVRMLDLPTETLRSILGSEEGSVAWDMKERGSTRVVEWAFR